MRCNKDPLSPDLENRQFNLGHLSHFYGKGACRIDDCSGRNRSPVGNHRADALRVHQNVLSLGLEEELRLL